MNWLRSQPRDVLLFLLAAAVVVLSLALIVWCEVRAILALKRKAKARETLTAKKPNG